MELTLENFLERQERVNRPAPPKDQAPGSPEAPHQAPKSTPLDQGGAPSLDVNIWANVEAESSFKGVLYDDKSPDGQQAPKPVNASVSQKSKSTARTVTKTFDMIAARGLNVIARNPSHESFRAGEEEISELEEWWAMCIEEWGWDGIPPWAMLMFMIMMVYGGQVPKAVADRKRNMRKAEVEEVHKEPVMRVVNEATGEDQEQIRKEFFDLHPEVRPVLNPFLQEGYCQWNFAFEDKEVPVGKNKKFAGQSESGRWAAQRQLYKKYNLPWPFAKLSDE